MTPLVEFSRATYNKSVSSLIDTKFPFDTSGPLFQASGVATHAAIRQEGKTKLWKSYAPFHTFPVAEATVTDGTIDRIHLENYLGKYPHEGIVVHGTNSDYNVFTSQDYNKGQSISTTVSVTASKDPLDVLKIFHANLTHKTEIKGHKAVNIYLTPSGIHKTKEIPFLQENGEVKGFTYDLEKEKWYVNRKESDREELTRDQLAILRSNGFTIPTSVKKNGVGLTVETILDGRYVVITVPSGMPNQNIFESFVHGEPLTPFSVSVDEEERVSQVYGDEAQKWYDQVNKIAFSEYNIANFLSQTRQNNIGKFEASIKAKGLFAHNQVTLEKEQSGNMKVEFYRLNQVYQWLVDRDNEGQLGVNTLGINVVEYCNMTNEGKISSDVYLKSDKGFIFRLRSEILKGGANFNHSFYMQLNEQNMTELRAYDKIAHFAGNRELNPSDRFIVKMTSLHSFELRKYSRNDMEGDYEVFEIDNNLLNDLFGFEIDPRDISIEGPVAHVGLSMRGHRYSVTVPSSFEGDVRTKLLENAESLVPMSIFTDAEGGWRDVMKNG